MKYLPFSNIGAKLIVGACALFTVGIPAASAQEAHSAQIVYDEDYYRQITYDWEDENGELHTSNLTESATEYNQIVALLREVYVNPKVPGFVEDPYGFSDPSDPNQYIKVPYEPCIAPGNPYGMTADMVIETPLSGATALIVELCDGYTYDANDTPEQMLRKIKEVQVVCNSLYIDAESSSAENPNPGHLFNFVGMLDKFFILTKGNNRIASNAILDEEHPDVKVGHAPFYNMYEEFSPSNKGPIYNAYPQMAEGETFDVDHNCTSIMGQNHIIVMSPEKVDREYPMNFMFFLPDNRFEGDTRKKGAPKQPNSEVGYEYYTYYSTDHLPYFFFNTLKAEIPTTPTYFIDSSDTENPNKAKVQVEWVSTYNDVVGFKAAEEFYVYRVENDVILPVPLQKNEYEIVPDYYTGSETEVTDDGALITTKRRCQIFVYEDRNPLSRDVYYIVKGRRYPSHFDLVESNTVNTRIAGYSGMENLSLKIDGRPRSTYDKENEQNLYENDIFVTDTDSEALMVLKAKHIHPRNEIEGLERGTTFSLRRYAGDDITNSVEVASMEILTKEARGGATWAVYVYDAAITYPEGTDTTGLPLTASFKSGKMYPGCTPFDEDEQPIIAMDDKTVWTDPDKKTGKIYGILAEFKDRFSASTHDGTQAPSYHYYMVYQPAVALSQTLPVGSEAYSNVVDVAVPVRDLRVGYIPYTEEDILADHDFNNMLPVNKEGIMFETRSNPYLVSYAVLDYKTGKKLVEANRMPTGQLQITHRNANDRMVDFSKENHANWTYIPVELGFPVNVADDLLLLLTYNNGNTYGNRLRPLHSHPEAKIYKNKIFYKWENQPDDHTYWSVIGFGAENLEGPEEENPYELVDFRLWGKHNAQEEYELVYGFSADPTFAPKKVRAYSLDDDLKEYTHQFNSYEATEENPVSASHLLRMYAKLPDSLKISTSDEPGYLVSDDNAESEIRSKSVTTGIETIVAGGEETFRYFDSMGRELNPDALPQGVIIRAGNGTVEKIVNQ